MNHFVQSKFKKVGMPLFWYRMLKRLLCRAGSSGIILLPSLRSGQCMKHSGHTISLCYTPNVIFVTVNHPVSIFIPKQCLWTGLRSQNAKRYTRLGLSMTCPSDAGVKGCLRVTWLTQAILHLQKWHLHENLSAFNLQLSYPKFRWIIPTVGGQWSDLMSACHFS